MCAGTFIVEDFIEDEFGLWARDEATGDPGYVDDKELCFLDMGQQRVFLAVQPIQNRKKKTESRLKAKESTRLTFGQTM